MIGALTLGGCLGESSDTGTTSASEGNATNDSSSEGNETNETAEDEDEDEDPIEERDAPEPEGGNGRPFTHYDLAVDDEHENGYPTWMDGMVGCTGATVHGCWSATTGGRPPRSYTTLGTTYQATNGSRQ